MRRMDTSINMRTLQFLQVLVFRGGVNDFVTTISKSSSINACLKLKKEKITGNTQLNRTERNKVHEDSVCMYRQPLIFTVLLFTSNLSRT